MKQQVVVIHGGTTFATYENYLSFLQNREVTIDYFKPRSDWKGELQDALGEGYEVLLPSMPSKTNARYVEWKIWFQRMFPFLEDNVILIGHSLGGRFLVKYLSEETFPKKLKAVLLVAAPYSDSKEESLADFSLLGDPAKVREQVENLFLYHSKDDKVVPISDAQKYKELLPNAIFKSFEDRGHFNSETFPEVIEDIKAL